MSPKTSEIRPRLILVDGNAVLHRAWHALPPLTTKDGRVISGAYGFMMTLMGAIKKFQPSHLAVAFDLAGPTFRHEQYEDYKATREKKPDELYEQIPILEEILGLMEVPVISAEGYEADDAIGTAAELASEADKKLETIIVTGDLDTLQLVNDRVKVFTMRKGLTDTVLYDPDAVESRYGLKPNQMVDYKALRGDPSDNIPGVKGVGEKTATQLISEFGSVKKLYAALDKGDAAVDSIKASMQEKLLAGHQDAMEALDLCRIRTDAPIDFNLKDARFELVDRSRVKALFEDLQFNRLLAQWPGQADDEARSEEKVPSSGEQSEQSPADRESQGRPDKKSCPLAVLKDIDKLTKELKSAKEFSFRSLLNDDHAAFPDIVGLGMHVNGQSYFLKKELVAKHSQTLLPFFTDSDKRKVCHGLKQETTVLKRLNLDIAEPFEDLMLLAYLMGAGERRISLSSVLSYYRNLPPEPKKPTDEERLQRLGEELPELLPAAEDLLKQVKDNKMEKLYREIELPVALVLARMERTGVLIDRSYLKKLGLELEKKLDRLTAEIHKLAGQEFNINSPGQISEILFEKLAIETHGLKKTAKGKAPSTAASELEKIRDRHPIVDLILDYRELAKLKSTYVDSLPELAHPLTNRIHAHFNQAVTATGRLSSSDPNLQNIPTAGTEWGRKVRSGFIAGPGKRLLAADYSQIELRLAAHLSQEKTMIEAFKRGEDIHWRTAVEMFGEEEAPNRRRVAKAINFGILYGMGSQRLAESANISYAEASEYIERYFALLPGLSKYIERMKEQVADKGYVETMFGRRRFFENFRLMNRREQAEAERQAVNTPLQGTQADMIKLAMIRVDQALREQYASDAQLIIQVHDELVFEVKEKLVDDIVRLVNPIMQGVIELNVPIEVNFQAGQKWGEMETV